jgi:maltose alpha-D-glucosyltransferase / alpha-amylase
MDRLTSPDEPVAAHGVGAAAVRPRSPDEIVDPLWYKDAIIYQLHVKAFFDGNDDGVGDFKGLTRKLDYLQELGVTALWLLPFHPSPLRDDGYDVADYKSVNPSYGRMADFKTFVREAHRRHLRVITELVVNHTSDQHPWFQRARKAKRGSPFRDFYVWSDTDQKFQGTPIIFIDTEKSNWTWDPVAQAYYWHRFYAHQPDLNFDNPRVFRAVCDVMRFWLDLGVDGLRLDAVPYLIEREGTINENLPETHDVLRRLRRELDACYDARMLLAEANEWPEDVLPYFGAGDECHMAFHFPLMPRIYMAVATEDRHPVTDIMRQTPEIPENCQWALFLRNHDELTLSMVSDRDRDYLWNYYAADRRARINLGIRRRLAPLMENDRRKIELLNALLMSLPGTPVLYYGDEIGMGDNYFLGDRNGVRTPMQWSFDRNGGFSRADAAQLFLPPIMDPVYGFQAVNVEAQSRSPSSLLNWVKRLIAARRSRRALSRGTLRFLYPSNRKVVAYLRQSGHEIILCVANLSRSAQAVELDLAELRGRQVVELLGRAVFPDIADRPYQLTLQGHSFLWFDLMPASQESEAAATLQAAPPEFLTLVMPEGWRDLFGRHNLPQLESEVIPAFLPRQKWFDAKGPGVPAVRVLAHGEIDRPAAGDAAKEVFLPQIIEAQLGNGDRQRYFLPLAAIWSPGGSELRQGLLPATLAELRQSRREGALIDALAHDGFARAMIEAIRRDATVSLAGGEIRFCKAPIFDQDRAPEDLVIHRVGTNQSNSSVLFENYAMLKIYRRLYPGPHPAIEMARFLTERAGFANTPPLLATIELDMAGETSALGVLFGHVGNQGDAWNQALDYLGRYLDDALLGGADVRDAAGHASDLPDPDNFFLMLARQIGIRTAEMHRALAENTADDPAFAPEPIGREDLAEWRGELERAAADMLSALDRARPGLSSSARDLAEQLLGAPGRLLALIRALAPTEIAALKTRCHGDFHLGQLLVVQNDFFVLGFDGVPGLSPAARRRTSSPLRDVAAMIRSFDYAAVAAVRQLAESRPAAEPRMVELAEAWRQRAVDGFRAAYRKAMRGCASYPASKKQAREMTAFFTLERAVHELSYELANRPAWAEIPLKAILAIVANARSSENAAMGGSILD